MYTDVLLTDLYQLTMMQGLYFEGKHEQRCVFDRYYRKNPFSGGYTVVAGLEHLIDYVENLHFNKDDMAYLAGTGIFKPEFLDYLKDIRFTGDIYAMPEGTVAFPQEVLLRVETKKAEALLLETCMSMIMNHESLIATKARRVRTVAGNDVLMEFGLRRAQGKSAGVYGARAAFIGGFNGTSNVYAGACFGIPVFGTMAHSWIMSFPTELDAFRAYARQYDDNLILLADTYNTLKQGVPDAITVFKELRDAGKLPARYGIRLDSGDLAYLSKEAGKMFAAAGFDDAIISASNDLDENLISGLKLQGSLINSWGVGTNLITSKDSPSMGGVFKLVGQYEGDTFVPKIKLSDNAEKISNPGRKNVFRLYDKDTGKMKADIIALEGETISTDTAFHLVADSCLGGIVPFPPGPLRFGLCLNLYSVTENWFIKSRHYRKFATMRNGKSKHSGLSTYVLSILRKCACSAVRSCLNCDRTYYVKNRLTFYKIKLIRKETRHVESLCC